ncbi:hypothetical protein [Pedobacter sp. SL55]|uniref:hypothetical protein n=1 Tax=Pedobacter sp. SL55 TaxID=2995161 RepID=UPI0022720CA1|nr:hypothetical protein [Pedobacter sp. SL55]WAC42555.1 hypothetical protein OVA16_09435 [Pedobacter sp. SL55]
MKTYAKLTTKYILFRHVTALLKLNGLCLLLFLSAPVFASECYSYHTYKAHAIIKNQHGLCYQFTEKDPNGFSYVKQINKQIKGIDLDTYKYAGEDEATFMFSDKNGFYQLPKDGQYDEKTAIYSKILPANASQKHINGRLFLINNKWVYFSGWKENITKVVLNELPSNISNVKCFSFGIFVKSDKQVFAIRIDLSEDKKYTIETIPNLNPSQLVYYACNPAQNEDFIADETHIFSVRNEGSFEDITPQFLALGVKRKFNQLKLVDNPTAMWWSDWVIKKREGHSVSGKNPLTGEELDINFSYSASTPLRPRYGNIAYVRFQNKIYPIWDDDFSQPYDVKTDASKLEAIEGKLFKGDDFYYFEADNDMKIISTKITADAQFFPGVYSYGAYLPKALTDEKYIYFIGDRFNIHLENKKELTSKIVKQLGMFYLFNNAFYDGEKSYPIKADYETLYFLGSFVEVINGCAGNMPNTPQVQVKYHQFFKDKNSVYYFDDKTKKLQTIPTADPADYKAHDYDDLQHLYKIKDVKGALKKRLNRALIII